MNNYYIIGRFKKAITLLLHRWLEYLGNSGGSSASLKYKIVWFDCKASLCTWKSYTLKHKNRGPDVMSRCDVMNRRLYSRCTQHQVETELPFLTTCQTAPGHQRNTLPADCTHSKGFLRTRTMTKNVPFLPGEIPQSAKNTAAGFVSCCDKKRRQTTHDNKDCQPCPALNICTVYRLSVHTHNTYLNTRHPRPSCIPSAC